MTESSEGGVLGPALSEALEVPKPEGVLFLCFAREDEEVAKRLAEGLTAAGVPVWCSAVRGTIPAGSSFQEAIQHALGVCAHFAVLVPRERESVWTKAEIGVAIDRRDRDRGFRIIPIVRSSDSQPLPVPLNAFHAVRLTSDPRRMGSTAFREFASELNLPVLDGVGPQGRSLPGFYRLFAAFSALPFLLILRLGCREEEPRDAQPHFLPLDPLLKMVRIEGGDFRMGSGQSTTESPVHRVSVAPFLLGETEITREQWRVVMEAAPLGARWTESATSMPANYVPWPQAVLFCNRLSEREGFQPYYRVDGSGIAVRGGQGYRLPSEAEWECACRAGPDLDDSDGLGWHKENSDGEPRPVRGRQANGVGLFDMLGNLWEWCEDTWHPGYSGSPIQGEAWVERNAHYRVLRGGSYMNEADVLRPTSRNKSEPYVKQSGSGWRCVGFRPARSID